MYILRATMAILIICSSVALEEWKEKLKKNKNAVALPEGDGTVVRKLKKLTKKQMKYLQESVEHAKEEIKTFEEMEKEAFENGNIVDPNSPSSFHQSIMKTPKSFEEIAEKARLLTEIAKDFSETHNIDLSKFSIAGTELCEQVCRSEQPFEHKAWKGKEKKLKKCVDVFQVWNILEDCDPSNRFRTISGKCNNLLNPSAGQSGTPLARLLPNAYEDGFKEPRMKTSDKKGYLSCARRISEKVLGTKSNPFPDFTLMVMQWGQFLDHDLSLSPVFRMKGEDDESVAIECCENGNIISPPPSPECIPICIPKNDPFFSQFNQRCMNLARSRGSLPIHPVLTPREQMNALTHFIDASMVYGSTDEEAENLRSFVNGRLKTQEELNLLPGQPSNEECPAVDDLECFLGGDERVNEAILLTVMHTVWLREHNRIADHISSKKDYDDETIYQMARKIVGAEVQHITFNEFLPIVLGEHEMEKRGLNPLKPNKYYKGYNPKLNPTILNPFSTAAYRFGHSLLATLVEFVNESNKTTSTNLLHEVLFNPFALYQTNGVEHLARGISSRSAETFDRLFTPEVTQHLFQRETMFGMDLPALNIQRGRDHGIQPYNQYRKWCKLSVFSDFYDMAEQLNLNNKVRKNLMKVYDSVDDIDLFVGGVLEPSTKGSILGDTFRCIISEQFFRLKNGDRFFYENGNLKFYNFIKTDAPFTKTQLKEIKNNVNLARIFCENTGIMEIQKDVFRRENDYNNPMIYCEELPTVDLDEFLEL